MTKTGTSTSPVEGNLLDRRRFVRVAESAQVEISFADPVPVTVAGELTESSEEGFRVEHNCDELLPGLQVFMRRVTEPSPRRCRVIWTHMQDGKRVSGCMFL